MEIKEQQVENEAKEVDQADEFYGEESEGKDTGDAGQGNAESEADKDGEKPKTTTEEEESKDEASEEESKDEASEEKPEEVTLEDLKSDSLKAEDLTKILETAKSIGLTKEQAQSYLKLQEEEAKSFEDRVQSDFEKIKAEWKSQIEKDPYIGGDKLKEAEEYANKALDYFGDETKAWIIDSGFNLHPGIRRGFAKFGRELSDDKRVVGSPVSPNPSDKSPEDIFYGQD